MRDAKRGMHHLAEEVGALPSEEMPTGDGTDTLEIERPPVRITFPGDAISARAGSRPWQRPASGAAAPAPAGSSGAARFAGSPALRQLQVRPVRARRSDR
jgi:hypothetical protein